MKQLATLIALLVLSPIVHADAWTTEEWLYQATLRWTPPFDLPEAKDKSHPSESIAQNHERRRNMIRMVWAAANDPGSPVLFSGDKGRAFTALMVLGVWTEESHFDLRVERHHCAGLPKTSCDNGRAWCNGQIHPEDVKQLGWSGQELQDDLFKCARATIERLAMAKAGTPKDANPADRFCGYAIGHFETPCPPMRLRYSHGAAWSKEHPAP